MFGGCQSEQTVRLRPERRGARIVLIVLARNDLQKVRNREAVLFRDAFRIRGASHFAKVFGSAFRHPEWTPHHNTLKKHMTECVTDVVRNVFGRFVAGNNEIDPALQQVRRLVELLRGIGPDGLWRSLEKLFTLAEKEYLYRKLTLRNLAEYAAE
jgi:hypothetical protein